MTTMGEPLQRRMNTGVAARTWPWIVAFVCLLAACGGGDGSSQPSASPPASTSNDPTSTDPTSSDAWASVKAAVEAAPIADLRLIVGDASGAVFTYEKGTFSGDRPSLIASSSKLLAGAVITRLIEKGLLSYGDNPQDHIAWWTNDPADPRSRITLSDLLAFTSGFNHPTSAIPCIGNGAITQDDCVRQIYDSGLVAASGTQFYYGPAHLHIAGLMAANASGVGYSELVRREIIAPLGLAITRVDNPSTSNPRVAGGGISTASEYTEILRAILAGELISCLSAFSDDRTANVSFTHRPAAVAMSGDWHYASGAWRECDASTWTPECKDQVILSSAGAFGWTPWIDFGKGYFALIAMEDSAGGLPGVSDGPSTAATSLEQRLQPLIETALGQSPIASTLSRSR